MLIALSVTLILLSVLLLYYEFLSKRNAKESSKPTLYVARAGTEIPVYPKKGSSKLLLPVLVVLFCCNTLGIVYVAARSSAVNPPPTASPTPSVSVSATVSVFSGPYANSGAALPPRFAVCRLAGRFNPLFRLSGELQYRRLEGSNAFLRWRKAPISTA